MKLCVQSSDIAHHIFAWSQQKINLEDLKRVFVFNSYSVCVYWHRLHYKTASCVPPNVFKVAQQLPELVSCSINLWPLKPDTFYKAELALYSGCAFILPGSNATRNESSRWWSVNWKWGSACPLHCNLLTYLTNDVRPLAHSAEQSQNSQTTRAATLRRSSSGREQNSHQPETRAQLWMSILNRKTSTWTSTLLVPLECIAAHHLGVSNMA